MTTSTADHDVDAFIADLERELREKQLSLVDSEILAAVEAKSATREQIREWAKVFYAATRHGRLTIAAAFPSP